MWAGRAEQGCRRPPPGPRWHLNCGKSPPAPVLPSRLVGHQRQLSGSGPQAGLNSWPKWPPLFLPSSCWAPAGLTLKGQNCSHSGTRQVPKLRLDTRQSSYTSCQSILAATPGRSLGSPRFADEETVTCPSHTARKRWSYGWVQVCLVPMLCHCLHATPPPPHQLASFHELEGPQDSQLSSPQSS